MHHETRERHPAASIPVRRFSVRVVGGSEPAFEGARATVGAADDCDLVLEARGVSRYHVELEADVGGIRVRDLGSTNGTRAAGLRIQEAVVPSGTVVKITGSPKNGFYPANWDGLKGYLYTDFLRETDLPVSVRGGSGTSTGTDTGSGSGSNTGSGSGSASGQAIVNFAMQYVGYPYVWATHGPGSFDCSGFTSWVVLNVLGIQIGYSVAPQFNFGTGVSRSNLQPGDIVFFENTYTFGLSHVGIYIGNNQFVHAENENTGVKVSDLNSTYYSSRYYGARRLA